MRLPGGTRRRATLGPLVLSTARPGPARPAANPASGEAGPARRSTASALSVCQLRWEGTAPADGSLQEKAAAPATGRCPGDRDLPQIKAGSGAGPCMQRCEKPSGKWRLFCYRVLSEMLGTAQPPGDYKEVTTPSGSTVNGLPGLVTCLRPTLLCHFQTKGNCLGVGVGRPPRRINLSLYRTTYNSSNCEAQAEHDFVSCAEAAHLIPHSSPPL
nr:PREDICTED: uncharacterized protein LOC109461272 [Rhinolophus sinicus]